MNTFEPESMSDLSFTQTTQHMASKPLSRAESKYRPWWEVVSEHNKKKVVITDRVNGEKIRTTTGYRKPR